MAEALVVKEIILRGCVPGQLSQGTLLGGEKIYRITVVVISAEYNKGMYSARP